MSLVLVTAPAAEPLTLAEVKKNLRVTTTDDDTLISALITVVRMHLDGRDGWLGRALVEQTWDLKLNCLHGQIELPLAPLRSITSITYLDLQNVLQTLATNQYQVTGIDNGWKGSVLPTYGHWWPYTYPAPECVTIRFVCGYAAMGSPPDPTGNIPMPIKQAMQLMIQRLYQLGQQNVFLIEDYVEGVSRQKYAVTDTALEVMNLAADMLLSTFRVWNFA